MLEDLIKKTENDLSRKARWKTRFDDIKGLNRDIKRGNFENISGEQISQKLNDISDELNKKDINRRIKESYRDKSNNRDWFNEYKTVVEMYERGERAKDGRSQKVNPHDLSLRALDNILEGDIYKTYSKRFEMADEAISRIGDEIQELRGKGHTKKADELSYKLVTKVSEYIGQNEALDKKEDLPDIESKALDFVENEDLRVKLIKQSKNGKFDQRGNISRRARIASQNRANKMKERWGYEVDRNSQMEDLSRRGYPEGLTPDELKKEHPVLGPLIEEAEESSGPQGGEGESQEVSSITHETDSSDQYRDYKGSGRSNESSVFRRIYKGIGMVGVLGLIAAGGYYACNNIEGQSAESKPSIPEEQKQEVENYFPYSFSPLEKYAEIEENLLKELGIEGLSPKTEKVREFGDELINRVSDDLRSEYDIKGSVSEEVNWLEDNGKGERDILMKFVANSLEDLGVFYSKEGLLSKSFDDDFHDSGKVHADCDLLTYFFLHVCEELGVPAHARMNADDLYFTVQKNPDSMSYVYEPTEFRKQQKIRRDGKVVGIKPAGDGVGKDFYSHFFSQKEESRHLLEGFEKRINLHGKLDEDEVKACIKNDIYTSLVDYAKQTGNEDLEEEVMDRFKQDIKNEKQVYLSVQNFYDYHVNKVEELMESQDYGNAQDHLLDAKWVKGLYPDLFYDGKPILKYLEAKLNFEEGDFEGSQDLLRELRDHYSQKEGYERYMGNGCALDRYHAETLLMSAIVDDLPKNKAKDDFYFPAVKRISQKEDWEKSCNPLMERVQEKYEFSSI